MGHFSMRTLAILLTGALPLAAQSFYNNVDKPGDSICPRIELDKDPHLAFGQGGFATDGGRVGANSLGVAHHQFIHQSFAPGSRKDVSRFTAYSKDNKPISVGSLKGKIVVVAFWSFRCEPSAEMLMDLSQLYDRREKFGFDVLAVNFDTTRLPNGQPTPGGWNAVMTFEQRNKDFFSHNSMPFYVPGVGNEGASNFLDIFDSMPVLCVVDPNGKLASIDMGYTSKLASMRLSQIIKEEHAPKAPSR